MNDIKLTGPVSRDEYEALRAMVHAQSDVISSLMGLCKELITRGSLHEGRLRSLENGGKEGVKTKESVKTADELTGTLKNILVSGLNETFGGKR